MLTHAQDEAAFQRICRVILFVSDTSPLVLALKRVGIASLVDFISLPLSEIDSLEYPTNDEGLKELDRGSKNLVKWFILWT